MNSVLARISHQRPAVDEAKGPASMARGNSSRTSPGVRVCRQTGAMNHAPTPLTAGIRFRPGCHQPKKAFTNGRAKAVVSRQRPSNHP